MSNDAKHTPAPWRIDRSWGDTIFIKAGLEGRTVVLVSLTKDERVEQANGDVLIRKSKIEDAEGNAHLIGAAPELLEALEELSGLKVRGHAIIDRLQFSDEGRALSAKILAAIAKAKGLAA